ncbi:hypothetical protein GGU10DRAFT_348171 [Lentinula aff. detonsa]|uniref:Uncharacterized protein n=1 Tax=Lentinula aff. detonsa TaxID=2804958 RepID=A0AA38KBE0_9AGAR|nr:hypothetical protein GGU10DRAFT_348171 [Lentinula aff. detonsa]
MASSKPESDPDIVEESKTSTPLSSQSTGNSTLPKAKLSAFARFKTLTTSGYKSTPEPQFPPTTWELSGSPSNGSGASDWDQKADQYKAGLEKWREEVKALTLREEYEKKQTNEDTARASQEGSGSAEAGGSGDQDNMQDAPDTRTLAMKIKALIDEKFTFTGGKSQSAPATLGPATSSDATHVESSSINPSVSTTPPAAETPNATSGSMFGSVDATLARFLSSESIMNGEVGKGLEKGRESVWAMLDKLGAMAGATDPVTKTSTDKGKGRVTDIRTSDSELSIAEGQDSEEGIMMCTPLQPTQDLPEIAESELEYVDDEQMLAEDGRQTPKPAAEPNAPVTVPRTEPKPAPKSKPKRTFYPSSTKLSLQVTWWGYRLFLPPPIIAQLSSAHIAAAKRGAMITAALKWLIDQVPLMVVPPQMRASILMLKRVSPYLGYVGAFVAWSWGRIQAKNEGQGVVLTATWLLPIAILPAAWDFEVHGRPRDHEAVAHGVAETGTTRAAMLDSQSSGAEVPNSSTPTGNQASGGTEVISTSPSADRSNFLAAATRRWNSMTKVKVSSTKEKTE